MNEKLMEKLLGYLDAAENFVNAQLPDFAQQFVNYETWACEWYFQISIIFAVLFFAFATVSLIVALSTGDDCAGWMTFITGIVFLASLVACVYNYADLKQLELAPKVYMIKQVKNMFTGNQTK